MWCQLLAVVLSRPMIHAMSCRAAHLSVASWRARMSRLHNPMYDEMVSLERKLSSRTLRSGIVGLVNTHGNVGAIATFEAPPRRSSEVRVLVGDVACKDFESGSALVRIITRTPGVGCAPTLPDRWRVAHAFYSNAYPTEL